ncbi:diguanylate cyclase domain-containing protein [Breoghania corrubedonensis]|uniref:diguanylate cyclase domain-containing protein n=1 Tax=Breoghania corrubedonensis TaxID=665038 RepID=UPI0014751D00|nr:diguanylate cyclase [Breoghania corrubedonensis]
MVLRRQLRPAARSPGLKTKDRPSAAGLLRDLARLKRTIFLVEFILIAVLFAYEVFNQYRETQEQQRDLVASYLNHVTSKARILLDLPWSGIDIPSAATQGGIRSEVNPLPPLLELEGYAAMTIVLGTKILAHADDGAGDIFDPAEIFPGMTGIVWRDDDHRASSGSLSNIRTGWLWHGGAPYFTAASPIAPKLEGRPVEAGDPAPVLIVAVRFDTARLAAIARELGLDDIAAIEHEASSRNNEVVIRDGDGHRVGSIVWNTHLGGAFHLLELTLLVAVVGLILYAFGRYTVQRLAMVGSALDRMHANNLRDKAYLRSLIEASNDGLIVLDADGQILDCNSTVNRRSGHPKSKVIGANIGEFLAGVSLDDPEFLAGHKTVRCQMARPDGSTYWLDVGGSRFEDSDFSERYIIVTRDVSARVEAEEAVWRQAHFDTLTDLPNRALFNTRLNGELMRARDEGTQCVLMFIDLDGFKSVNDTRGHDAGDVLLARVAERFRKHLPAEAMVARLGGDEFAVILPAGSKTSDAKRLAKILGREISQPYDLEDEPILISASIGIAEAPRDGCTTSELLRAADKAMYTAKRKAPGSYAVVGENSENGGDGDNGGYRAVKRYS